MTDDVIILNLISVMARVVPMLCGILLGFKLTKLSSIYLGFSGAKDSGII